MTADPQTLQSHAEVPTLRAERWRKQLVSHLGRKATVQTDGETVRLLLTGGSCAMTCDSAVLRLAAEAPDEAALARVQDVVGRHLERFAAAEALRVRWQRVERVMSA